MPVIKSKMIRVRDPETGFWHDLPATVSEESFRAAERALQSETAAAASAASAASSASTAGTKASEASASAASASTAANNASSAMSLAFGAANTAEAKASDAQSYAGLAASAASVAGSYKDTAVEKAAAAALSEENAAASASSATASETAAQGYAASAESDAGNAASSASASSSSATAAASSASSAASSETAAASSAEAAEAWATGGSSGTPSATNNAEYWAGQAEDAAESVSASAAQIAENTSDIADVKTQLNQRGIPTGGSTGQSLRKKSGTNYDMEWADVGLPTDEQTADAVSAWLDEHPEATTTVEDHSLTYEKLVNGTLGFVAPEMFGAKGDGETDDSIAWQTALDSGKRVIAFGTEYYIGTPLNVNKGNEINCNGASFTVGGSALFVATNTVVSTLAGSTYNKNVMSYDTGNTGFNGYCVLVGTNNPMPFRDYYKSGFVAKVDNGIIYEGFPVDIESPSLYFYNDFTFELSNIGNIVFNEPNGAVAIKASNCYNLKIENINSSAFYGYSLIRLHECRNSKITNIRINNKYENVIDGICYPIIVSESAYTLIEKCDINNQYWHCITTSTADNGVFTCYVTIRDCVLTGSEQFSYLDHSNTFGTTILNSTLDGICVYGMPTIKDCVITSYSSHRSKIRLCAVPLDELSCYVVENIKFMQESTSYNSYTGIELNGASLGDVTNKFMSVAITNIYCNTSGRVQLSLDTGGKYELRNISVRNLKNLLISMEYSGITATVGNYIFEIADCFDIGRMTVNGTFRNVIIANSYIKSIAGTFTALKIANATISNAISGISGTTLVGNAVSGTIENAAIMAFTNIDLSDFCGRWVVKKVGTQYLEYSIDNTGAITATVLT